MNQSDRWDKNPSGALQTSTPYKRSLIVVDIPGFIQTRQIFPGGQLIYW